MKKLRRTLCKLYFNFLSCKTVFETSVMTVACEELITSSVVKEHPRAKWWRGSIHIGDPVWKEGQNPPKCHPPKL